MVPASPRRTARTTFYLHMAEREGFDTLETGVTRLTAFEGDHRYEFTRRTRMLLGVTTYQVHCCAYEIVECFFHATELLLESLHALFGFVKHIRDKQLRIQVVRHADLQRKELLDLEPASIRRASAQPTYTRNIEGWNKQYRRYAERIRYVRISKTGKSFVAIAP